MFRHKPPALRTSLIDLDAEIVDAHTCRLPTAAAESGGRLELAAELQARQTDDDRSHLVASLFPTLKALE